MKRIVFLLMISFSASAQQSVAEAPLGKVEKDGFYNIPLPPMVTALLESDLGNIRLVDADNQEAPYLIKVDDPEFSNVEFVEYVTEIKRDKGCCTTLTLINKNKKQINNIILEVRNAETVKEATLLGSDDKEVWYSLKERFILSNIINEQGTSQLRILDFPLSDYSFYKIIVGDSTTAPVNIVRAGYYDTSTDYGSYVQIPSVSVSSVDSVRENQTWVTIRFDTTQFIDKLELGITGPKFYRRFATLYEGDKMRMIDEFDITSTHSATINNSMKAKRLIVLVMNESNVPLKFTDVRAWQLRRSLTSLLKAGHVYKLVVGSGAMKAPLYDLQFFRDSIPSKPPMLEVGELTHLAKPVTPTSTTYFTNRNIIWLAIILVGLVLGAMTVRMLRDKNLSQK